MKRLLLIIFVLIVACDNKPKTETLTADLYFTFFRISSYYNQPDSTVDRYENYFDTLNYEIADKEQKKFFNQYKRLKEENLLYQPFVHVLTEKDSVATLYLETAEYNEIKKYKRKDLQKEGKKIKIQADVRMVSEGLFYCVNLRKVEKVDGETGIKSKKWKIEDYE